MKAALLAAVSTLLVAGDSPEVLALRTTVTAETLRLPQKESLGLVGLSATADLGPCYLGPGLYGAARGERGGFFTFGLEGGMRGRPFADLPLELDAGLFLGGGGGGSAPQGGGLMLRPHLGASLALGKLRLGAELSRVRFPNGGIDSTQAALTLAFTADHLWVPTGGWGPAFEGTVAWQGQSLDLEAVRIDPSASTHTRSGLPQPTFDLAGLSLTRELSGPWFRFLAVDGAARGSSSGYAQAMAGLGLRTSPLAPFGLEARLGAGMGGGGNVDTGGGFLLWGEGAITMASAGWKASVGLGFQRAPGGSFDSRTLSFRVSHRISVPLPDDKGEPLLQVDLTDWRVGSGLLLYRHAQRQDGTEGTLQMMTLRADRLLGGGFYLSGEAGSATGGRAGGYSTGLAGLGWESPQWARQRLFAETAIGAGGGGGLRSGGGLLASFRTGWRLELPRGLGLEATLGKVRAPRGELDSTTFGLGLNLRFRTLER